MAKNIDKESDLVYPDRASKPYKKTRTPIRNEVVMSSMSRNEYPKPTSWKEFEDMVLAAQRVKWKSPNLQKYGRQGQAQNGIDIYGPDDLERTIGIQCKKLSRAITINDVEKELDKADQSLNLSALYIATSNSTDAKLQMQVRALSGRRALQEKSAVAMLFWEDIIEALLLEPKIFNQYYPGTPIPDLLPRDEVSQRRISFDLGTYSAVLHIYVEMTSRNDPFCVRDYDRLIDEYINILLLIKFYTSLLTPSEFSNEVSEIVDSLIPVLKREILNTSDIDTIYQLGRKLETHAAFIWQWNTTKTSKFIMAGKMLEECLITLENNAFRRRVVCRSIMVLFPTQEERICKVMNSPANNILDNTWIYKIKNMIINSEIWGLQSYDAEE